MDYCFFNRMRKILFFFIHQWVRKAGSKFIQNPLYDIRDFERTSKSIRPPSLLEWHVLVIIYSAPTTYAVQRRLIRKEAGMKEGKERIEEWRMDGWKEAIHACTKTTDLEDENPWRDPRALCTYRQKVYSIYTYYSTFLKRLYRRLHIFHSHYTYIASDVLPSCLL